MKNQLLLLFGATALLASGSAARAFVYENAYECQGDGDFDGDGRPDLVIVDKATGSYRLAYQLSTGTYTWVAARASGITPVTSVGLGKLFNTNRDALAFTGPDANRINLLDASNSASAGTPISASIPSLGPNLVGVIDIGGAGNLPVADLYIGSIYNDPSSTPHETLLRNDGTTQTLIVDNALAPAGMYRERANVVFLRTNSTPRLAFYERNSSLTLDTFRALTLSNGAPVQAIGLGALITSNRFDYVYGQFSVTNPLTQFVMWSEDYMSFWPYQVNESPPGNFYFTGIGPGSFPVTNRIERLFVLPAINGARLLVIYAGGTNAAIYNWDGTANPPTVFQAFSADVGEHLTGIGVMGNKGFMAYSAPLGQNTSAKFKQWNWNGSAFVPGASGNLPTLNQFTASGNVIQFQYEPFVTNNPVMLRINNAGDWSSKPIIGASVTVFSESFAGPTQGLVNPVVVNIGPKHPLAAFGLANQYSNTVSLFSFTAPQGDKIGEATIAPPAGAYPTAVTITFTNSDPTQLIYFRIGGGAWAQFTGQNIFLFTNGTVQYYAKPPASFAKTTIRSAAYTFPSGPAALDSNKDGVPDFVAVAVGLDPNGPRDADKDGFSNFEELLHGTDPTNAASLPTTNTWPVTLLHIDDQSAFDLAVTALPWDGFSNTLSVCATGVVLQAYNLQGAFYASSVTTNPPPPLAQLTNISIDPLDRLIVMTTPPHYSILTTNTNSAVGREMVGLVPLPVLSQFTVPYAYGGSNIFLEATNWIIAASNAWRSLQHPVVPTTLSPYDTLEAVLFEKAVAILLGARGDPSYTNLTLFPYRTADVGRTNPPQARLLALETNLDLMHPGYQLKNIYLSLSNSVEHSPAIPIANLRSVVLDIYRMDSLLNNAYPATFVSPVDEIRLLVWSGTLDSNYLYWSTTSGLLASASNGVAAVMAGIQPRPTTNLTLLVRPDTFGLTCRILDQQGTNAPYVLQDSAGLPFSFPANFQLPPGSQVSVYGYTDGTNTACAYPAIEVISIGLAAVPIATDQDTDGNLLIDSWEDRFFGHLGVDPFADSDGDGYSNLQEMLDGSDPSDFYGRPATAPVIFTKPVLTFQGMGSQIELLFQWPAAYVGRFNFGVRHSPALGVPFSDLTIIFGPANVAGDEFKIAFSVPATPYHFYYLTISLH